MSEFTERTERKKEALEPLSRVASSMLAELFRLRIRTAWTKEPPGKALTRRAVPELEEDSDQLQHLSFDRTRRRKLHPQNSRYLASKIIAPTGTRWVSSSCRSFQRAGGSTWPGAAEASGRSLIAAHSCDHKYIHSFRPPPISKGGREHRGRAGIQPPRSGDLWETQLHPNHTRRNIKMSVPCSPSGSPRQRSSYAPD